MKSVGIAHTSRLPTYRSNVPPCLVLCAAGPARRPTLRTRLSVPSDRCGQPAVSTFGSPATSAVGTYWPSSVVSHTLGSTLKAVVHTYHDELAHSVMGLRQSGH